MNACVNDLRQLDGAKQQWALENRHDVIAADKANQHTQAQGDQAFDEHPTKIFEVLEKAFNWSALFFL